MFVLTSRSVRASDGMTGPLARNTHILSLLIPNTPLPSMSAPIPSTSPLTPLRTLSGSTNLPPSTPYPLNRMFLPLNPPYNASNNPSDQTALLSPIHPIATIPPSSICPTRTISSCRRIVLLTVPLTLETRHESLFYAGDKIIYLSSLPRWVYEESKFPLLKYYGRTGRIDEIGGTYVIQISKFGREVGVVFLGRGNESVLEKSVGSIEIAPISS